MILTVLHWGRAFLTLAGLFLAANSLFAQGVPNFPLPPGSGYGAITNNFGATGYGTTGTYGITSQYSVGISGGGGAAPEEAYLRSGRMGLLETRPLRPSGPLEDVAHLHVLLPSRDATLWVNDALTKKH